jgi:hypothetical protein
MWWIKDPDRLKAEVSAIDSLLEEEPWLSSAAPRFFKDLSFAIDFELVINGGPFPFRLRYPTFFPETPPSVIPRDGRHLSGHQYGTGGELCLEYRSDNWDPSVTGSMLIESTQRLLSTEASDPEGRAIVASAHASSIGQQLRGWVCRFLVTSAVMEYIAALPVGAYRDALVVDIRMPNNAWTAYIKSLGPADTPEWSEAKIPDRADTTVPGILVRIESLADLPISPEHDLLDRLVVSAQGADAATRHADSNKCLYTVIADAQSQYCSAHIQRKADGAFFPTAPLICRMTAKDDFRSLTVFSLSRKSALSALAPLGRRLRRAWVGVAFAPLFWSMTIFLRRVISFAMTSMWEASGRIRRSHSRHA